MGMRERLYVIAPALLLRLGLFFIFPSVHETLANRVEISTPVTGFKRLQEGLFLYKHGLSPYDGGVFHQAPLLLAFFNTFSSTLAINLTYTLADCFAALALMDISASGVATSNSLFTSSRKASQWAPWQVGLAYLFNPFTIATCISRSTIIFSNTAILVAIAKAVQRKSTASMLALAMAAYLSLYPALLLPPLALVAFDAIPTSQKPSIYKFGSAMAFLFAAAVFFLLALSFLITGRSWEFLRSTYGVHLLLPDLTPNVGLWWYFFIEMFDSFREFFLCVFQLHLLIYVGGLSIRLRKQPLFAITTLLGICSMFKSYPSIGDTTLYLGLLALYRHVFSLMRYTFFAGSTLLYTTLLGPAFYYLWIYAGSGNANFFYAITLVWCLALTVLLTDALHAVLRDEWEVERPEMKDKDVVQI